MFSAWKCGPISEALAFASPRTLLSSSYKRSRRLSVNHLSEFHRDAGALQAMANAMSSPRLLVVSDLDNTMVDHQDKDNNSLLRFGALWEADYRHDSLLVFSTGRSPVLYEELRRQVPLLTPDIAITSVGTEIVYGDTLEPDLGWTEELSQGWDRNAVVEEVTKLSLKFQAESEQRPHKLSFHVDKGNAQKVVDELSEKLKARGLKAKLIYSGGLDLDILPQGAGKGQALAYLLRKFKAEGRSPEKTLVCGDSGNDAELFAVANVHGVLVGNAMDELVQWYEDNAKDNPHILRATERCAAGILQAMQQFDLCSNVSPRDLSWKDLATKGRQSSDETSRVASEVVEYHIYYEKWVRGEVENSEEGFYRLKFSLDEHSSMIDPLGKYLSPFVNIDKVKPLYGSFPQLRVWVDRIRIRKVVGGVWNVVYNTWRRTSPAEKPAGHTTSALIVSQEETPNGFKWLHLHDTFMEEHSI